MSKMVRFYDAKSGIIHPCVFQHSGHEHDVAANAPLGHQPIHGAFDHLRQRIDLETGTAIDYQPPAPSADHEWDEVSKRWKLNAAVAARDVARASAVAQIRDLESRAIRALIEQALGQEGAKERLEALHRQITDLRPSLAITPDMRGS